MTKPFTYLIKCTSTNQFYYGVRYAKNCHPSDLWTTYFTSSKYVRSLIEQYGRDAFSCEVRKQFTSAHKAKQWESRVLKKMKVSSRKDFINKHDFVAYDLKTRCWMNNGVDCLFVDDILISEYVNNGWTRGRIFSKTHKDKISSSKRGKTTSGMLNKTHSDDSKFKMSQTRSGKIYGRTIPVTYMGKYYPTIKAACLDTGSKYWKVKRDGIFTENLHLS